MGKRIFMPRLSSFTFSDMIFACPCGGMVYAHGLEPCGSNPLEVRLLSGAPKVVFVPRNIPKTVEKMKRAP